MKLYTIIANNDGDALIKILNDKQSQTLNVLFEKVNNKIPLEFAVGYIMDPMIESHHDMIRILMKAMKKQSQSKSRPYFNKALQVCCLNEKLLKFCVKYCDFNTVIDDLTIININLNYLYKWINSSAPAHQTNDLIEAINKTVKRCKLILAHTNSSILDSTHSPLIQLFYIIELLSRHTVCSIKVCSTVLELCNRTCKEFINWGCNVNAIQYNDITPLMVAIKTRQYKSIKLLIEYDVDLDHMGSTGNQHCLKLALIEYGQSIVEYITRQNKHDVVQCSKIVKLLLYHNVNVNYVDEYLATSLQQIMKIRYKVYNKIPSTILQQDFDRIEKDIFDKTTLLNNKTINQHNVMWYILKCNTLHIYKPLLLKRSLLSPIVLTDSMFTPRVKDHLNQLLRANKAIMEYSDKPSLQLFPYKYVALSAFNTSIQSQLLFHALMLQQYPQLWYFHVTDAIDVMIDGNILKVGEEINDNQSVLISMINIYKNKHPTCLNNMIIWIDEHNYTFPRHFTTTMDAFFKSNALYFMLFVAIVGRTINHANIIIFDKERNEVERYDPYGDVRKTKHNQQCLDNIVQKVFTPLCPTGLVSKGPQGIMGMIGLQTLSHERNQRNYKHGDPKGYCLAWCYWFLEMRLQHNLSSDDIYSSLMDNTYMKLTLMENIRNYANDLQRRQNKLMVNHGIDWKYIYDNVFSPQSCLIIAKIYNKFF